MCSANNNQQFFDVCPQLNISATIYLPFFIQILQYTYYQTVAKEYEQISSGRRQGYTSYKCHTRESKLIKKKPQPHGIIVAGNNTKQNNILFRIRFFMSPDGDSLGIPNI